MRASLLFFALSISAPLVVVACGAGTDITDSATSSSVASSSSGMSGGCTKNSDCPANQGCLFGDAACTKGVCLPFPMSDCGNGVPECLCGGGVDEHACPGTASDLPHTSDTSCFPTTFDCGDDEVCNVGSDYCRTVDLTAMCVALPSSCGSAPSCACLSGAGGGVGCSCSPDEFGNLTVTCQM